MALDSNDYGRYYDRMATLVLARNPRFMQLCTRNAEVERMGRDRVVMQDIQFGTTGDVTEKTGANMGGAWQTANQMDLHQVSLIIDRELSQRDAIRDFDLHAAPIDLVAARDFAALNKMALKVDDLLANYALSLATTGKASQDDGSGVNGNAGPIRSIPTVGVTTNGKEVGLVGDKADPRYGQPFSKDSAVTDPLSVIGKGLRDMFRNQRDEAEANYQMNGEYFSGTPGDLWIAGSFRLSRVLSDFYEEQKLTFDPLNRSIITMRTPGVLTQENSEFGAMYNDIVFVPQTGPEWEPAQTSATTKAAGFPFVFGTRRAIEYGLVEPRTRTFDALEMDSKQNERRSLGYIGYQLVNAVLMGRGIVESIASTSDDDKDK